MQKKGSVSLRNRINATVRDIPRSGIRDFFDIVSYDEGRDQSGHWRAGF